MHNDVLLCLFLCNMRKLILPKLVIANVLLYIDLHSGDSPSINFKKK